MPPRLPSRHTPSCRPRLAPLLPSHCLPCPAILPASLWLPAAWFLALLLRIGVWSSILAVCPPRLWIPNSLFVLCRFCLPPLSRLLGLVAAHLAPSTLFLPSAGTMMLPWLGSFCWMALLFSLMLDRWLLLSMGSLVPLGVSPVARLRQCRSQSGYVPTKLLEQFWG